MKSYWPRIVRFPLILTLFLSTLVTGLAQAQAVTVSELDTLQKQLIRINKDAKLVDCPDCHFENPTGTEGTTQIKDFFGDAVQISVVDQKTLDDAFNEMAAQPHIPFGYPEDGCYARAHEMARLLEAKGITTAKIFISGYLRVETENSPQGFVEWGWHVAPIVTMKQDGKPKVYVIDPSLFKKAVPLEEWVTLQIKDTSYGTKLSRLDYTKRFVYMYNWGTFRKTEKFEDDDVNSMKYTMEQYLKIQRQREADRAAKKAAAGGTP